MKEEDRVSIDMHLRQLQGRKGKDANVWLAEIADTLRTALPKDSQLVSCLEELQKELQAGDISDQQLKAIERKAKDLIGASRRVMELNAESTLGEGLQSLVSAAIANSYFRSWPFRVTGFLVTLALVAAIGGPLWSGLSIKNAQDRIAEQERTFAERLDTTGKEATATIQGVIQTSRADAAEAEKQLDDLFQRTKQLLEDKGVGQLEEIRSDLNDLSTKVRKLNQQAETLENDERWKMVEGVLQRTAKVETDLTAAETQTGELLLKADGMTQDPRWEDIEVALQRAHSLPPEDRWQEIEQALDSAKDIKEKLATVGATADQLQGKASELSKDGRWGEIGTFLEKAESLASEDRWKEIEKVTENTEAVGVTVESAKRVSDAALLAAKGVSGNVDKTRTAVAALLAESDKLLKKVGRHPDQETSLMSFALISVPIEWLEPLVGDKTAAVSVVFAAIAAAIVVVLILLVVYGSRLAGGWLIGYIKRPPLQAEAGQAQKK